MSSPHHHQQPSVADEIDADNSSTQSGSDPKFEHVSEKGLPTARAASVTAEEIHVLAEKLDHNPANDDVKNLAPESDIAYVLDKVSTLTVPACREILTKLLKDHEYDYNFSSAQRRKLESLLSGPSPTENTQDWELALKTETAINRFYSPYPEVRAVTTPEDDPDMPCETIRAHLLGYLWACICQFINSLFNSRFPLVTVTAAVAQVLLYPSGLLLSWILPDWRWAPFGWDIRLSPGKWNYKEQMLSTIIVNVSVTSAYVFWNIQTETVYYHDKWLTPAYQILLLLSTQLMGLGFAGMMRRFVVYQTQTFWPSILPTLALNRALLLPEEKRTVHGWVISKYKFFWITFAGMFVYYWIPGYLFNGLSFFAWMTWIAPDNFNLATVTGSQFGLGFNPLSSFDWNVFANTWLPLAYPCFSFVQQYIGAFIGGLVILWMYYTNYKWSAYLPINSSGIFDNTGNSYNITNVMDGSVLDEAKYRAYSPPFYSAGNIWTYGVFFAYYPLTMVFVCLDFWRPMVTAYRQMGIAIWNWMRRMYQSALALVKGQFRESYRLFSTSSGGSMYDGFDDPFCEMMRKYPEVPDWWFLAVLLVAFIFAIVLLVVYQELATPVWTIFFVLGINLVYLLPMTIIYAISGTLAGLNVLVELVVGYALPGHPEALMFVKAYGYNTAGQADYFISDLKMGHYAKIPPRAMFRGQTISVVITSFIAYGVLQFVDGLPGICTPDQPAKFSCANGSRIYFASSVVWGAIGPQKIFDQIYPEMKWAFLVGFILALVWWTVKRFGGNARVYLGSRLPRAIFRPLDLAIFAPISWLRDVHPSLLLLGNQNAWAPTNLTYFTSGLYFSIGFMYYLKRYKTAWFEKYNYILSASFSAGVAFSAVIVFFAVQYHPVVLSWWGNNVTLKGVDAGAGQSALITQLPDRGYFGPATWT